MEQFLDYFYLHYLIIPLYMFYQSLYAHTQILIHIFLRILLSQLYRRKFVEIFISLSHFHETHYHNYRFYCLMRIAFKFILICYLCNVYLYYYYYWNFGFGIYALSGVWILHIPYILIYILLLICLNDELYIYFVVFCVGNAMFLFAILYAMSD
mgnify:CR=1 FL=1|jgi:hypothetical protein